MKCKYCKKEARQYMADSNGEYTHRYYVCENCKKLIRETLDIRKFPSWNIVSTEYKDIRAKKKETVQTTLM